MSNTNQQTLPPLPESPAENVVNNTIENSIETEMTHIDNQINCEQKKYNIQNRFQQKHHKDSDSMSSHANGWTEKNTKRVRNWLDNVIQLSYVYEKALERYKNFQNKLSLFTFILTSISSYLSLSQFNMNEKKYPEWALAFKILLAIFNVMTAISSGMQKIYNIEEKIKQFTQYCEKIDSFASKLAAELSVPSENREQAFNFIQNNKDFYQKLLREAPMLPSKLIVELIRKFNESKEQQIKNPNYQRFLEADVIEYEHQEIDPEQQIQ